MAATDAGAPAAPAESTPGGAQTGKVKWFNSTKGFGFITPDDGGEELFVHQTSIKAEGFRSLDEGEAVEFTIETASDGRTKAINVTGPGGAYVKGAPRRNEYGGGGGYGGGGYGGGGGGYGGGGYGGGGYGGDFGGGGGYGGVMAGGMGVAAGVGAAEAEVVTVTAAECPGIWRGTAPRGRLGAVAAGEEVHAPATTAGSPDTLRGTVRRLGSSLMVCL
ncbi:hypothetical protein CLOM_g10114 [Closterium sp. NIES-68]|nr:hypothetical protein CLOM_g10114 [Closterium sp. NIES-68]GJP74622.1 hypothetical protein CLOP_g5179 [Closterium sp. NIES-67]